MLKKINEQVKERKTITGYLQWCVTVFYWELVVGEVHVIPGRCWLSKGLKIKEKVIAKAEIFTLNYLPLVNL